MYVYNENEDYWLEYLFFILFLSIFFEFTVQTRKMNFFWNWEKDKLTNNPVSDVKIHL